jgi:hypothetical protein
MAIPTQRLPRYRHRPLRAPDLGHLAARLSTAVPAGLDPVLRLSQGRNAHGRDGGFDFGSDVRDLFSVTPDNIFMVKLSYWMSR